MRFVDAHTHLELMALQTVPFDRFSSVGELVEYLKSSEGEHILAWGWEERKLGRSPTREDLDAVDRPVLLLRMDAHLGVVNSKLVEDFGLRENELFDPEKGFLYENQLWELVEKLKPKGEKMKEALLGALKRAEEMGIVEIHDYVDPETATLYADLDGELPIRVVLMPYYDGYREVMELFKGRRYENLYLGWVKVFVDGSVGARTAYLREPYEDRKGWRGRLFVGSEEISSIVRELEDAGLRISLHAIGDSALDECLRAFERSKPELSYHRIEHAILIDREQALRVKEFNILLCLQPNFRPFFGETYIKALGEDRYERCLPLELLDSLGVDMVFGSDMMPFDSWYGFNFARDILGEEKAKYYYGGWRDEGRYI